ncbi:hypothetical protein ACSCB1_24130 [Streptomyces europaeiscabiei]|nr:hypothetical protein [Streptomyces europaeiscabiei]MDX2764972.1 hypothetical protein [Streptomyces europaeiscabiei]MDX3840750.1 hypothetical protein [Streptomyces europaeiscabiei]
MFVVVVFVVVAAVVHLLVQYRAGRPEGPAAARRPPGRGTRWAGR